MLDALLAARLADYLLMFEQENPWRADAACREHPELNWFPTQGEPVDRQRAVCSRCLVLQECRQYADANAVVGIWAGIGAEARRRARRRVA